MEENWKSEDRGSSQSAGGKKRKGGMMDTHSRGGSENYKDDDDSDGDSSSDDERPSKIEGKLDRSAQLRKEKRLAMNRESARQRRKRKKILIQSLEGQVSELTTQAEEFKASNDRLMARLRSVESELQIANSTISYLLSSQPQGGRAASLPIPGTLLRTNMPFGPALRPQGLGGNAQLDDNLNVLLQAQLASLAQNSPESARSLYQRDGSVRHALDANIFAQMGNRGAPIGSVPHASFYGSRPLGTMRYGTASPGIHAASLENVVSKQR